MDKQKASSQKKILWGCIVIVGIGCLVTLYSIHVNPSSITLTPAALTSEKPKTFVHHTKKQSPLIFVHIAGAVNAPGIYSIEKGMRVFEAVRRAGGFTENAYLDKVNLAGKVKDGQRLYIPSQSAKTGRSSSQHQVNINSASLDDLMRLPGVGPTTAKRILDFRHLHGAFKDLNSLSEVKGIGPHSLEKLKSHLIF